MWLKLDFHSDQPEIPNKVPLFMRVVVATFLRGMRLRRMLEGRAPWEVEAYGCFGLSDDADGQAILAMMPWQAETGTTARGETDHHFVWQTSL